MTIRRILVPLTGSDADGAALATAFATAAKLGAHVDATLLRFDQRYQRLKFTEELPPGLFDEVAAIVESEDELESRVFDRFEAARQAAGAVRTETVVAPGGPISSRWLGSRPAERVIRDGRLTDLLVLGRGAGPVDRRLAALRAATLTSVGRPLLLAPEQPSSAFGNNILIAWNGGTHSARAVGASLPFLQTAATVRVLTLKTPKTRSSEGERLADYLAWHGVRAHSTVLGSPTENAGELILRHATTVSADLVVMGGKGQTRLADFLFGGVTGHVLDNATLPVLITH